MKPTSRRLLPCLVCTAAGNIVFALVVKLFLLPSGLPSGGTTGLALIVRRLCGIPVPAFVLIFNVLMLLLGLCILGRSFAATTVLSSVLYPLALEGWNRLLGDVALTTDPVLCTAFAGLGVGLSLGVVIRSGSSTGGMDIPPLVLHRLWKIPVSVSLYAFDCLILLAQAVYNPPEKTLYGVLLILLTSATLDKMLMLGASRTQVKVVSTRTEEIRAAILTRIDRGVTMLEAEGGYSREPRQVILSVISNRELPRLERLIHAIDPACFMIVSRVTEVTGRGFTLTKDFKEE
ncbi:MAG: YitT family protein [Clostridia bacterium]|nr:YitT family protein [Clostridia bacterium]